MSEKEQKESAIISYNRHTYMDARNTYVASSGLLICSDDEGNLRNFRLNPIANDGLFLAVNIEPSIATPVQLEPQEVLHNVTEQTKRLWLGKPQGHFYVPGAGAIEKACAEFRAKYSFNVKEVNAPSVPIAGGTGAQAGELHTAPSVPIAK